MKDCKNRFMNLNNLDTTSDMRFEDFQDHKDPGNYDTSEFSDQKGTYLGD
jgi:hypothetical protein